MTIVAPDGTRSQAPITTGKSYFRKAGRQHDVLNETNSEIVFLEVESSRTANRDHADLPISTPNITTKHLFATDPS